MQDKKTVVEDMVVPIDRGTPIYTEKEPPILRNFQISTIMGPLPIGLSLASHLHEAYPGSAWQPACRAQHHRAAGGAPPAAASPVENIESYSKHTRTVCTLNP